jgi:hypothetical protein
MPPFVSVNGLAGDIMIIGGIISRREAEISSLQERVIELENTQEEESEAIKEDIRCRIKDLEKELKATTQERSKKPKNSEITQLKRKRMVSSRRRVIGPENTGEGKAEEDINRRIKDIENQLKATRKERSKNLKELAIAYLTQNGPIIERIEELQQLNDHDRSLIAPIRKLPAELLGYVFQHHVDLDHSPWVLILVSRSWRHTAMTTPSLWVHLLLVSVEHRKRVGLRNGGLTAWRIGRQRLYSKGRRVVCHDPGELNTIVSRTGSLPLDIHIAYRNDNTSVAQSVLGDTAIARRIASLAIDAVAIGTGPMHDVTGVTVGSFPLLHTLTIFAVPEKLRKKILESISSSSPQIKRLITHQHIHLSPDFPFWSRIRFLNLNRRFINLNNLIPHLGELETLEDCPPGWPDESTPEVSLAKLTTLSVYCVPEDLCRLQLPALLRLSIDAGCDYPPRVRNVPSISLPALEVLELNTTGSPLWLALLSAPYMRVFALRDVRSYSDEALSFPNFHFPAVQDFTFHSPCVDQVAISVLECVPNVKKVAVTSSRRRRKWGLEILQRLTDAENMLCPNMTHFTLGSSPDNRVIVSKAAAESRARKAIKNRLDRGIEMDHFEIHFDARSKIIQYA